MRLKYKKYGEGPPLIILHGLYGSSDNWVTIAKNLSDTYTIILPDQRNHGESPHSDIHNYESMRDDLYELVKDLNLKKIFLAGHSMGGKTAISFAINWPEMLNGLLVADISPFENEERTNIGYNYNLSILNAMLSVDLKQITSRRDAEELLMKKITDERIAGFILKNLHRDTGNNFSWKINLTSVIRNLGNIMEGVIKNDDSIQPITGFPVIFLKGSESDYLVPSAYREILQIFPAAEIKVIEKAGHWIHAERPDEVIRYLKSLSGNY